LTIVGVNIPEPTGHQMALVYKQMLGEVGTWIAIWWPLVSGIFAPKIVKIRQSVLKLQSIMSGSLFWDTV